MQKYKTVKFITTDHPIINIFAKLNKIPEKGKHTFYYPVSPNLGKAKQIILEKVN